MDTDTKTPRCSAGSCAAAGSAGSPWPARDIVSKLVEAADLLLDHCDYDGDGWEAIHTARAHAREWLIPTVPTLVYCPDTGDISIQLPNTAGGANKTKRAKDGRTRGGRDRAPSHSLHPLVLAQFRGVKKDAKYS